MIAQAASCKSRTAEEEQPSIGASSALARAAQPLGVQTAPLRRSCTRAVPLHSTCGRLRPPNVRHERAARPERGELPLRLRALPLVRLRTRASERTHQVLLPGPPLRKLHTRAAAVSGASPLNLEAPALEGNPLTRQPNRPGAASPFRRMGVHKRS
eukprot:scaffold1529_cov404-Prasinococcus_capsulatus_cf.AAC.1